MRSFVPKRLTPKVYLRDANGELINQWHKYFRSLSEVEISQGNIFDIKAQAIVSPANSFGFMDGGIDLLYRDKFGMDVEKLVQKVIELRYYGELPVGQATSVPMKGQEYSHLIVAPTMHLPMNVDNTLNAYQAFRATLLRAKEVGIESLVCPGLGTGTGKACPELVARQMFVAYSHIILQSRPVEFKHILKQMVWMLRCSQAKKV